MLWAQKETKAWFETSDIEGRTAIYDPHLNVRFKVNRVFVRSRMMWCVCRRFRVLWIGLGFLLKAMVFTFTLEKNHLKCQFSNEGNQCALSPSDSSVWKHASTYALLYMYNHFTKKFKYFVCIFDWYETCIGKAIQIRGEWTWSKSYRYICIRSIDFFTCLFEANCNAY